MNREYPISFSTEMVKAILAGQKSQTRRVIKPQPPEGVVKICGPEWYEPGVVGKDGELKPGAPIYGIYDSDGGWGIKCPYGPPGTILWVRETWCVLDRDDRPLCYAYMADCEGQSDAWRPSVHMPRMAARLFLRVKGIRVERLWSISEEDARAEGIPACNEFLLDHKKTWCRYTVIAARSQGREKPPTMADNIGGFAYIWDKNYAERGYGWNLNPWVWVIEFERV